MVETAGTVRRDTKATRKFMDAHLTNGMHDFSCIICDLYALLLRIGFK